MRCLLCVLAIWGGFALAVEQTRAQLPPDNPYAWREEVNADPRTMTSWPPFYKSHPVDAKHEYYYKMGWCRRKAADYRVKPADLIDVNKLPIAAFNGKLIHASQGLIAGLNAEQEPALLMVHPNPAVSKVVVRGTAEVEALKNGMFVRFLGKVDAAGQGLEKVGELELFTPEGESKFDPIVADQSRTIAGRVVSCRGGRLIVTVPAGKIRRVSVELSDKPEITVNVSDYSLASEGDATTVKGHVYRAEDPNTPVRFFASEVEIKLAQPLGKKKTLAKL